MTASAIFLLVAVLDLSDESVLFARNDPHRLSSIPMIAAGGILGRTQFRQVDAPIRISRPNPV